MAIPIERQTSLSGYIVLLARFLRKRGFQLTTVDEGDVLKALALFNLHTETTFVSVLRAVFCKNKEQYARFPEEYLSFVEFLKKAEDSKTKELVENKPRKKKDAGITFHELKNWLYNKPIQDDISIHAYSDMEALAKKDFSSMSEEEIRLVLRLLEQLSRRLLKKKSRARKRSKKYTQIDMSLTLRNNFRSGTEINKIFFSEKKERRLKLVLLCDVSRSMDLYSRFFVQMMYSFQNMTDRIETFVFSTALVRISEMLERHSFKEAFQIIGERIPQWSGGTRIGQSLKTFCDQYGHSKLDRKTIVLILSDGWDNGKPELMEDSMRMIHKNARKVLWLNPLAGNANFSPDVIGLQAALPFIDQLVPAHNLESLKKVIRRL